MQCALYLILQTDTYMYSTHAIMLYTSLVSGTLVRSPNTVQNT